MAQSTETQSMVSVLIIASIVPPELTPAQEGRESNI